MPKSRSSRTRRRGGGDSARPVYSFLSLLSLPLLLVVAVAATAWGRTAPALRRRREGSFPTVAPSPRLMRA